MTNLTDCGDDEAVIRPTVILTIKQWTYRI